METLKEQISCNNCEKLKADKLCPFLVEATIKANRVNELCCCPFPLLKDKGSEIMKDGKLAIKTRSKKKFVRFETDENLENWAYLYSLNKELEKKEKVKKELDNTNSTDPLINLVWD